MSATICALGTCSEQPISLQHRGLEPPPSESLHWTNLSGAASAKWLMSTCRRPPLEAHPRRASPSRLKSRRYGAEQLVGKQSSSFSMSRRARCWLRALRSTSCHSYFLARCVAPTLSSSTHAPLALTERAVSQIAFVLDTVPAIKNYKQVANMMSWFEVLCVGSFTIGVCHDRCVRAVCRCASGARDVCT